MSVIESDIQFYGSANMPDGDGTTTGGALDTSKLIFFNDISPFGTMDYVSSSASDTAVVITLSARDSTGAIVTEAKTLTGTTAVAGAQSMERLLKGVVTGTTAVGDVAAISHTAIIATHTAQAGAAASGATAASITLQAGDGASVAVGQIIRCLNNSPAGVQFQLRRIIRISGDVCYVNRAWGTVPSSATTYSVFEGMLFDISPNQVTQIRRPFYNAAADVPGGATRTYYEKIFAVDNNTVTALTVVSISKQVDPSSGTLQLAVCKALNDTQTATNRQTLPTNGDSSSLTFTSGSAPQSQNVPSPQNLPPGAAPNAAGAQGIWLSLALTAGLAAAKTSFDIRATGQTT